MSMIYLPDLHKNARGFTQAFAVGSPDAVLPTEGSRPQVFTRTYMSSLSGDILVEVGAGVLDPIKHTRVLMQYAADNGRPVREVADEYIELLGALGKRTEPFRRIIAGVMGTSDRAVSRSNMPTVTPTFVFKQVESALPATNDVLLHMVTDFVCHMLRPLGWIMQDAPYVYRLRRVSAYPRYKDLVDVLHAKNLLGTLQTLADADLSLVKNAMEKKGALLPAMVAQHLSNAVIRAYDLSRGTYDAEAVVRSVLTVLGRTWDPETPRELAPSARVMRQPVFAELVGNLSLFLAYQDMICREKLVGDVSFSDEELASQILPLFAQAMTEVSPYKLRVISDTVAFMGKSSARDHMGRPDHTILFEDWDFSTEVNAFSTIRLTGVNGEQRFLEPQTRVSTALEAAMQPVKSALNVRKLVQSRVGSFELVSPSERLGAEGTMMILGFPSLIEREVRMNIEAGRLQAELLAGETERSDDEVWTGFFTSLVYDYYATLVHLAVARSEETRVSTAVTAGGEIQAPILFWRVRTNERAPLGHAAIVHGEVITAEPLERLAYADDFEPLEALKAAQLPIEDFRHGLHIWRWHDASVKLELLQFYPVKIRNKSYEIAVDEHEMLNLGSRLRDIRFMRPNMATAVARLWVEWLVAEQQFIDEQLASTSDELQRDALKGRRVQVAIRLAALLEHLGSQGAGAHAKRYIKARLAAEMAGKGVIDEYADIHVGVQNHRLNIWAGLVTLRLLSLINASEAARLSEFLADNEALSMMIGTVDLNYEKA